MTIILDNLNKNLEIIELLNKYNADKDYKNLRLDFRNKILPTLKYKSENQQSI